MTKEQSIRTSKSSPLILLKHYLPGFRFGGQLRSVANIVAALGDDFDLRIGCLDRDQGDTIAYSGLIPNRPARVGGATIFYLRPNLGLIFQIVQLLRQPPYDTLYMSSFFDPLFAILPVFSIWAGLAPRRRIVIAPSGEFYPGALRLKPTKKRLYLLLARLLRVYRNVVWQATASDEIGFIVKAIGGDQSSIKMVSVIPKLWDINSATIERGASRPLRVVFFSRISQKKNLTYAMKVLSSVRVPVHFTVIGPVEDETYLAECEKIRETFPSHIQYSYVGAVGHEELAKTLLTQDVFLFPTLGENFGYVIFEALNAGLPIILSDRTPWRGLERSGVGFDISLDDQLSFVNSVERLAALDDQAFAAMRRRAQEYAKKWFDAHDSVTAMRALLSETITSSLTTATLPTGTAER
jgi:glycosyltransferase involved in cell wall biosynthesis